jgi:dipeptidase
MPTSRDDLIGCDTLVGTATATADRSVIFAKNSDRLPDECQHLRVYPSRDWEHGTTVRCQYVTLPQVRHTYRVLGSQPFWLWGFEHGVNERGVAIGNEAIWTTAPRQHVGLLGMDLIRLGLERGGTAREALDVMTALLEKHGQGGSPRHNDPKAACYDSSFILADPAEAWVLETSGRDWAARRIEGIYSISNVPCLASDFDLASRALRDRAGLDFARDLGEYTEHPQTSGRSRCKRSRQLLQERAGRIGVVDMMSILRDHGGADEAKVPGTFGPTLCAHPGTGQTAASMVAHLHRDGIIAWCSLVTPCIGVFLPFFVDAAVPEALARGAATFTAGSPWWRIKQLLNRAAEHWGESFPRLQAHWREWQQELLREAADYRNQTCDHKSMWVNHNVTRLLTEVAALERALDLDR